MFGGFNLGNIITKSKIKNVSLTIIPKKPLKESITLKNVTDKKNQPQKEKLELGANDYQAKISANDVFDKLFKYTNQNQYNLLNEFNNLYKKGEIITTVELKKGDKYIKGIFSQAGKEMVVFSHPEYFGINAKPKINSTSFDWENPRPLFGYYGNDLDGINFIEDSQRKINQTILNAEERYRAQMMFHYCSLKQFNINVPYSNSKHGGLSSRNWQNCYNYDLYAAGMDCNCYVNAIDNLVCSQWIENNSICGRKIDAEENNTIISDFDNLKPGDNLISMILDNPKTGRTKDHIVKVFEVDRENNLVLISEESSNSKGVSYNIVTYDELLEKNYFGVSNKELRELSMLDKSNWEKDEITNENQKKIYLAMDNRIYENSGIE